jgi:hypothetical protein
MSITTSITRRRKAIAGTALVALSSLGGAAGASTSVDAASPGAVAPMAGPCTKEYEFFHNASSDNLVATAHLLCGDSWQPQSVAIQMWYSDEWYQGWITVATGTGGATEPCNQWYNETYRHSRTRQQIRC